MNTPIRTRLAAFSAAFVVTFAVFASLADYGLPAAPATAIVMASAR